MLKWKTNQYSLQVHLNKTEILDSGNMNKMEWNQDIGGSRAILKIRHKRNQLPTAERKLQATKVTI